MVRFNLFLGGGDKISLNHLAFRAYCWFMAYKDVPWGLYEYNSQVDSFLCKNMSCYVYVYEIWKENDDVHNNKTKIHYYMVAARNIDTAVCFMKTTIEHARLVTKDFIIKKDNGELTKASIIVKDLIRNKARFPQLIDVRSGGVRL